jgi:hypothetical protein
MTSKMSFVSGIASSCLAGATVGATEAARQGHFAGRRAPLLLL